MFQVDDDNPPWTFRTSDRHDPMLYGYRGLIVDWDYTADASDCSGPSGPGGTWTSVPLFRLNGEDEAMFTDDMDWRPDDFHRSYCPYRRLVGAGVMHQFAAQQSLSGSESAGGQPRSAVTLAEHVWRLHGELYGRDQVQPICRPIAAPTGGDWNRSAASAAVSVEVDDVFPTIQRPVSSSNSFSSGVGVDRSDISGGRPSPSSRPVLVVSPTSPRQEQTATGTYTQHQISPAAGDRPSSATSSAPRGSPTTSGDSEGFVDASAVPDWSPSTTTTTLDRNHYNAPHRQPENGDETLIVETVVNRRNDVIGAPNGNGNGWNGHDESVVMITRHVTVSKDVGNCRLSSDGKLLMDGSSYGTDSNGLMYSNNDALITGVPFSYVIEENTRKTIRSDI